MALNTIPRPKEIITIHQDLFLSLFTVDECIVARAEAPGHPYQPIYYDPDKHIAITTLVPWDRITQWLPKPTTTGNTNTTNKIGMDLMVAGVCQRGSINLYI